MSDKLFSDYPQIRNRIAQEIRFKRDVIRRVYTHEYPYQRRFRVSNFRAAYVQGIITGLFSVEKPIPVLPQRKPTVFRKKRVKRTMEQRIFGDLA